MNIQKASNSGTKFVLKLLIHLSVMQSQFYSVDAWLDS